METQRNSATPKTPRFVPFVPGSLAALVALTMVASGPSVAKRAAPEAERRRLDLAKVYFEYNSSANDLGVHVSLDGEGWKSLTILNSDGETIFEVDGTGPYADLGLTELFFEGAEPSLDEVPLEELLGLFPEGKYAYSGETVAGGSVRGTATLTHAIPAGPAVSAEVGPDDSLVISWETASSAPEGFPDGPISVVGYQVIIDAFQVTLPATTLRVTVPPEFVATLGSGEHLFEVLAIEAGGNQTITEGAFVTP